MTFRTRFFAATLTRCGSCGSWSMRPFC